MWQWAVRDFLAWFSAPGTQNMCLLRAWCCLSGIRCHWIWLMWEPYKWLWKQTLKEYLVQFIDNQSISSLLTICLKMEKDTAEICRSYIIFFALLIWGEKKSFQGVMQYYSAETGQLFNRNITTFFLTFVIVITVKEREQRSMKFLVV